MPKIEDLLSVAIEDRAKLPAAPGVYFVLDATGDVLYIGRATNVRARWAGKAHHRYKQLRKIDGARIAYWEVPTDQQENLERIWIQALIPPLNDAPTIRVDDTERVILHLLCKVNDMGRIIRTNTDCILQQSALIGRLLARNEELERKLRANNDT